MEVRKATIHCLNKDCLLLFFACTTVKCKEASSAVAKRSAHRGNKSQENGLIVKELAENGDFDDEEEEEEGAEE